MTMKKRAALLGLTAIAAMALPNTAMADGSHLAPDFRETDAYAYCSGIPFAGEPLPKSCSAEADATTGGALSMDLDVTTPLDGRLPGPTSGSAHAYFSAPHEIDGVEARAFLYTVTVQIDQATASGTARALGTPGHADATLWVDAYLEGSGNNEYGWASRDIVESRGEYAPASRSGEEITLTMLVGDGTRRIRSGTAGVSVRVSAYASAGANIGTLPRGAASLTLDARVTSVTVETLN